METLMAKVKQLTVTLENRPGTLAHMAKVLADAKVNVLALLGSTSGAQGSAQVVVDNVNKAKKALGEAGLSWIIIDSREAPARPSWATVAVLQWVFWRRWETCF